MQSSLLGVVFKMSAAAADAWLSVLVKCGHKLIKTRQVVKCYWRETFAVLLDKLDLQEVFVAKSHL